jgi:hypothetical protein
MANGALRGLAGVLWLGVLPGCAVVESQAIVPPAKYTQVPSGIPYFLPRRPFVVTVSEPANGGVPTITVTNGVAEPDLSQRYVLSQGTNLVADNEFNIGVSAKGLLTNSTSTATSQVTATVQNLGTTIGTLAPGGGLGLAAAHTLVKSNLSLVTPPPLSGSIACPKNGNSYQIILYPESSPNDSPSFCGSNEGGPYTLTWRRADLSVGETAHFGGDNGSANSTAPVSGIFFRHELPYLVTVRGPPAYAIKIDTEVTSPDESETDFFPVNRSFFANNTANITITDGVITGVDQTTKSEIAAAVGLPAAFVSNYTGAVGQVFNSLSTNSADQQKLIQQVISTSSTQNQASAVAAVQNQICANTIASYKLSTLSSADLAKAQTAIKAACPGS